ncbi:phage tail-collar fiber domain-containing protein [Vibrio jasicida]|uniref:Phage tail protein n=1 Tax=Vibrio jasicida TaxID=766224 RepID=A0ABW7JHJ1_9VIBR
MSQILTNALATYKAQQEAAEQPVILDQIVFAYVPGIDPEAPIDPNSTLPPEEQIVYRYDIPSQNKGFINPDAVVYSCLLGTDIGTWTYNSIYLVNSELNLAGSIITTPDQVKVAADPTNGIEGDTLVRNIVTTYANAQELTQITVAAEVWQLDFTLRLAAMDERVRQINLDEYGHASFFEDGWKVTHTAGATSATISPGVGYVGGLKSVLSSMHTLDLTGITLPKTVYVVSTFQGQANSAWETTSEIRVETSLDETFTENGYTYYSAPLALLSSSSDADDLRQMNKETGFVKTSDISQEINGTNPEKVASEKALSKGLETKFSKYGGTLEGSLVVASNSSVIHDSQDMLSYFLGKVDGNNNWYIGKVANDDTLRLYSYRLAKGLLIDTEGFKVTDNGTYKVYHEGNKPNSSDVGAYSKQESDNKYFPYSGGTINGSNGGLALKTTNTINYILAKSKDNDNQWYVGKPSSTTDEVRLFSYLANKGLLIDSEAIKVIHGSYKYKIYHEGNKPNSSDVGSYSKQESDNKYFPYSGGTIEGSLIVNSLSQITHNSQNSFSYFLGKVNDANNWYVGKPGSAEDLRLYSYTLQKGFLVDTEGAKVADNGTYRIYHEGYKPSSSDIGALSKSQALGHDQSYYSTKSTGDKNIVREANVLYTNNTARPIYVNIAGYISNGSNTKHAFLVDGNIAYERTSNNDSQSNISAIVPPGSTYKIDNPAYTIISWSELR